MRSGWTYEENLRISEASMIGYDERIHVNLSKEQIENAPDWDDGAVFDDGYRHRRWSTEAEGRPGGVARPAPPAGGLAHPGDARDGTRSA